MPQSKKFEVLSIFKESNEFFWRAAQIKDCQSPRCLAAFGFSLRQWGFLFVAKRRKRSINLGNLVFPSRP